MKPNNHILKPQNKQQHVVTQFAQKCLVFHSLVQETPVFIQFTWSIIMTPLSARLAQNSPALGSALCLRLLMYSVFVLICVDLRGCRIVC